mmetsp:Transcript_29660/g.53632  ORF Transcript_29660/g.53632 Transcript_29660/m.53632 type:complete len:741 (+) Transcript_29660:238-2460(+)|eukprot:CAMPEP_0202496792 /NCGR_PEP_ID=MMETSP1361-20130828/20988_1 /ASSEMBLY_ACC=CAM_ASM_000849 /TAXON_ID=210615 /ORGANISM="Staurosira complex sp., Strain CCMP2646" /LENGTH=740 /DNA_ID=CAMNT_0049128219 /DNA_START=189 /DNA_END=2411 /DNA_ORIENTATION=-
MGLLGRKKRSKEPLIKSGSSVSDGSSVTGGAHAGPGAQSVAGNTAVFRVLVPENVNPGDEFQVYAGTRIVRVRCPPGSAPGQSLSITVPIDKAPAQDLPPDSPNVRPINDPNANPNAPRAYMVTIPAGILGGQQFPVTIQGQQLMVTCPLNARPGMSVRVVPPPPPTDVTRGPNGGMMQRQPPRQKKDDRTQLFEVEVPPGVQPGQPFALLAGGQRVLVTCPANANPGQRIRFKLPLALLNRPKITNEAQKVRLKYDKDGWTRTVRITDLKFQWVRMDDNGDVDTNQRFDIDRSAYVRKLEFRPGEDPRIRTGLLSLVPAADAVVDSKIKSADGRDLVSYEDIADAQVKAFEEKADWFQKTCAQLCVEWNEGHMRMNVRRQFLLGDSVDAVMSLSRKDLRKLWRFEFIGEAGIDAGGLAREWFQLVTSEIFDPDMGLWQSSQVNQMCMQINPASEYCCEDHLVYFRFLGRVMGKALFDRQLVSGHMVQHLYKHLLAWPVTFADLERVDEEYYNNLKQLVDLAKSGDDLSMLCLDFTTTQEVLGQKEEIELVKGGKDVEVNNDNFPEYLEACLKYRMLDRVKTQLNELLLGFFDVIPEPLLTIFDFQELELLMCGLPEIDLDDWMENTEYSGEYDGTDGDHEACIWFWEVVQELDQEFKARLLQFVTGTSGVPARGFGVLQGNDGNVRKFTIHGVHLNVCIYPRAHTCFNRIDLPMYTSKEELREKLKLAVTMVATGFDIE